MILEQLITNNYNLTKDSDVVVITSGLPRKRNVKDDLIDTNSKIWNL